MFIIAVFLSDIINFGWNFGAIAFWVLACGWIYILWMDGRSEISGPGSGLFTYLLTYYPTRGDSSQSYIIDQTISEVGKYGDFIISSILLYHFMMSKARIRPCWSFAIPVKCSEFLFLWMKKSRSRISDYNTSQSNCRSFLQTPPTKILNENRKFGDRHS